MGVKVRVRDASKNVQSFTAQGDDGQPNTIAAHLAAGHVAATTQDFIIGVGRNDQSVHRSTLMSTQHMYALLSLDME